MTANADVLVIEEHGAVRLVRLNRPDALNAADEVLHHRMATVWDDLEADEACRVVVLTGAGRAFCAGGDLGVIERMHRDARFRERTLHDGMQIARRLVRFPLPLVCAVNGPAVGLGCSLVGFSDVAYIEESAYLADPHVSVGLVAGDGAVLTWPALTSLARAKEYLFTGDRIPASVAVEIGLANHVVPDGTSVEHAMSFAERLAAQPAQALRDTKRALNKHLERAMADVLDFAMTAEAMSSASEEHAAIVAEMRRKQR